MLAGAEEIETVDYPGPEADEEEAAPPAEPADPEENLWLGRAKLLDVGSWMLYPDESGRVRPLKLAWVSEDRDRYVFVGRDGQKALEIQPKELADKLKTEEVDVADHKDEPLMDRSWQSVVQRMHDQIAHQATHDELTGLLNRKEFERRLKLKVSESKLIESHHVVLLADVDQFRVINATAGHEAGDRLLQNLAEVLREVLPEPSEIARVGPDDFAMLIPRCDSAAGHELANRVREAVRKHNTGWLTRRLNVTISIGVAGVSRDSGTVGEVLNRLEVACGAAKEEGDRIRSFEVEDTDLSRRDEALYRVSELESALDEDRLDLVGQLIQPLCAPPADGAFYEVLARIRNEQGKLIKPDDFVPAAEAYGRIHLLDERVIDQTLSALADAGRPKAIGKLSINLSGRTFGRPRFVDHLRQRLGHYAIPASSICLEITESAAMSDLSRCADLLRELRYLGFSISLDDFGTGLSSFSYLKHLPVDYLKIDGSFIREIERSKSDYGLVKSMHQTARLLDKRTVAEYAESKDIISTLEEIGIDYIQGFAVEEPRPLADILSQA